MRIGPFDYEPASVALMEDARMYHEIYLSDARRTVPENLKTVIWHPIKEDKQ